MSHDQTTGPQSSALSDEDPAIGSQSCFDILASTYGPGLYGPGPLGTYGPGPLIILKNILS